MSTRKLCGWKPEPREVEAFVSRLERPLFALAAPDLKDTGDKKNVFLWEAEQAVLGKLLPAHDQGIGDCVSHGWGRGVQDLLLVQIAFEKLREKFVAQVATEPIYAGSRVEIGGGRISGDGSVGAWAARYVKDYGILLRQKYDRYDLSRYNPSTAKEWGRPRAGVPDILEPIAREHPVQTVSLTTSYEEARDSIANGYPVPVCSMQGFAMQRERDGFCRPKGSWAHCMEFRGCFVAKGNRPGLALQQSWGESPTGPDVLTLEDGREVKLPQGCFGVDADVANRMLSRDPDSYTISNYVGYPRREPNFIMI